ncbi:F-box domain-containing protein [Colletotrichum higginsianum]|uniref:F-box domain-containing protein n=1 Tax=Colletotrichum higginsianum (strain IMI 349063) TaxID=759273 RepID=H1W3S1_COLHI|nr:F-box domain-containing protein [Colletotrichum higginsianum IMI 349063]OBR15947.1 F-box domain-containing protein [Colletotrichum higginsianum IMI 349063]CCF47134.1 F-box domain-containing protein [Colletotrichum higginsianum]
MDPPHITEFASERYFNKLNQLCESPTARDAQQHHQSRDSQLPPSQSVPTPPTPPFPSAQPSSFILPLRTSKASECDFESTRPPDQKRPEKSRLFSLRSKVSILHSKSHASQTDVHEQSAESLGPKTQSFGQLILALPTELQIQVISSLPLTDVLNLRRVSKSWHAIVTLNEAPIVRHHLEHHIPTYALRLYPSSDPTTANFHHLCGLWHRLHVAAKLSFLMCEWITKEIFLRTTETQRLEFAPQRERMRRRLIPLLFTVFHFFETYRKLHLQHILDHNGHGLLHEPYTLNPIEVQIMNMYDDQTLLRVHQVFPLVISSFCRRLRPPSYAGRVERSLRGYLKEKPPDEVHVAILCVGGLRQVERLWEIKGYNSRRGAVDIWYNSIAKDSAEPTFKQRRGIMGLGRKKSTLSVRESIKSTQQDGGPARRGSRTSLEDSVDPRDTNLVFNTSLAAGMPMGALGREHVRHVLADLPNLQEIWLKTAEALILERGIVERTQDIKRNAQVMLELIREDGMDEEDEWWYGRSTPESVRPPLEAIDEDPMDGA